MMHQHHSMHPQHQAVGVPGGHPGQHMSHHGLPVPPHHQMPPHQMHREQNRIHGGPGVSVGGGMSGMSGMSMGGPPPPQHVRVPPPQHHPRPPPPPRHLAQRAMQPPVLMPNITSHPPQRTGMQIPLSQPVGRVVVKELPPMAPPSPPAAPASPPAPPAGSILPNTDPDTAMANSKEKTPMCLVNELARFNKIPHQYRLTSEQGPAHHKRFTVSLRLGGGGEGGAASTVGEEYCAEGFRIRAAQHAAAAEALRLTAFPRPPPRPPRALRNRRPNATGTIMPTVELNALAMKLGKQAEYVMVGGTGEVGGGVSPYRGGPPPPSAAAAQPPYNRNSRYYNQNSRFLNSYNKYPNSAYKDSSLFPTVYQVRLTVGTHLFHGEGSTPQAARHDAAARALRELRTSKDSENGDDNDANSQDDDDDDKSTDSKSPVSMVHEIALKFNLPVTFDVKSEKGPPHMKVFITVCAVAEHLTEGEGNSKKVSKKRAAEKMLEELKKLPSVKKSVSQPEARKKKQKQQQPKKRTRNLIKEKVESSPSADCNPVSRLVQFAMSPAGGGREPVYTLLVEGPRAPWRRGFTVQCRLGDSTAQGQGPSKKLAKRSAADNMLVALGLGKTPSPSKPALKSPDGSPVKLPDLTMSPRKVTFLPEASKAQAAATASPAGGAAGRQLVPGLLLMQDANANATPNKNGMNSQTTATIAKELLRAGKSPTGDALAKQDLNHRNGSAMPSIKPISSSVVSSTSGVGSSPQTSQVIRPKDQLLYLAQLIGFQVQFSDFPKANHGEYLSLVSLSTDPPMVCHGGGLTIEQSHDQSARAALEHLSQLGIDNVTPQSPNASRQSDGIHTMSSNNPGGISGILTNGLNK